MQYLWLNLYAGAIVIPMANRVVRVWGYPVLIFAQMGGAELTRFLSPTCAAMQGIVTLTRQWPEAVGLHTPPTFADMTMMVPI